MNVPDPSFDPTLQSMRSRCAVESGVSRKALRGPEWTRELHGVSRPASAVADRELLRISDAVALLTGDCALGGWAALRVQGNTWFDGIGEDMAERDVLIHCFPGSQLRVRSGIRPSEALVFEDEVVSLEHYDVTTPARAAYDEMCMARGLREAVCALNMSISVTAGVPHTTLDRVARVVDSHHKTRGIVQARAALALASNRSASPWESKTRLIAQLDAGITGLLVNVPIFDPAGGLLGIADLLDPQTGLVIESDGAGHREAERHADDNRREEKFERSGLVVCRVTSLDHGDRWGTAARIRAARVDAKRSIKHSWTLAKPNWWWTWPPARRWD